MAHRASRSWPDFLYVTAGFPLGIAWLTTLCILIALGIGMSIVIVGIPILAGTLLLAGWGANAERQRAALVLGAPIPRAQRPPRQGGFWARWRRRLRDQGTWRDLAYMLLLGPVGILAGGIVLGLWSVAIAAVVAPAFAAGAPADSLLHSLDGPALAGVAAAGVGVAVLALAACHVLAVACAALAQSLLEPDERSQLAARISTLEATRSGAVESADARLRRVERDLHDGAQHRLSYIAMELGRARAKLHSDPVAADALLADAHEESKRALRELRELVRGIHPSVLTDRGLDAALSGLAHRCPVPVSIDYDVPARPPVAIETAAYYVVAEALTNVGRHAGAQSAAVSVRGTDNTLRVEVGDDGEGGARRVPGSGLEGLGQRVEALDGTLTIDSPEGGPTTILAELPCTW